MPSELKKPEPVACALKWPTDHRLNLSTVFDTEAEARDYLGCSPGVEVVPVYTDAQLEQYAADRVREALEAVAAWKTADGKTVQPGDKVWVAGSVGVHETTVSEPVTTYHLFGPIPVSRSYSTKKALLTALRTLKEQTK